jgi:hypothetical protein
MRRCECSILISLTAAIDLGKIHRALNEKKIRWSPSPTPEIARHRLYWALGKSVDYYSDFVEVISDKELILPDDIPCFPLVTAFIEFGITAVDRDGNESDMTGRHVFVDFALPKSYQFSSRNIILTIDPRNK